MRLFIAIELPKNVKKEAVRVLDELKRQSVDGRFVPAENMHITLSFLGETEDLTGAVRAMQRAVEGIRSFPLHLGEYDSFSKGDGDSVTSHITVKGDLKELNSLYESLNAALADEGLKTTKKRYVPHITLGRSVVCDEITEAALKSIEPPLNASMSVNAIVLFQSVRRGRDMVYVPLHRENLN